MCREIQNLTNPLIVSWSYHPTPDIATGLRFIDILERTGTKNPSAALTVPAAIQFMQERDWDNVRCQCHLLLRQAIERICDLTLLPPLYPFGSDFYSQMGIAPLPASNLAMLKSRLYDECKREVPLTEWHDKQFIRVSVQGYNVQEDIDALVSALESLIPQVAV